MTIHRVDAENPLTLMSPAEAEAIAKQVLSHVSGSAMVSVRHARTAKGQLAVNEVKTIESETEVTVGLTLSLGGRFAAGFTTRTDADGIAEMVKTTEGAAKANQTKAVDELAIHPPATFADPPIFFDTTISAGAPRFQGDALREAGSMIESAGLLGAAHVAAEANLTVIMNTGGFKGHTRDSYGGFSATARNANGTASGWGWYGAEDFGRVDPKGIVDRAIDLCKRTEKAVAVEPGRYTVILEPEAVAQLMEPTAGTPAQMMSSFMADLGYTVYAKKEGGNKLGLKMADERVRIVTDPNDPDLPFSPMYSDGSLLSRTEWFEAGILKNLAREPFYAKKKNLQPLSHPFGRGKLEISGPSQTLDDMVKNTERGIWVHRFSPVGTVNARNLLLTGVTRDGTFLIEKGKITRPIKNLRFIESPFFILNRLVAFGPIVRASRLWAAPRLKVYDFDFTSLSEAV